MIRATVLSGADFQLKIGREKRNNVQSAVERYFTSRAFRPSNTIQEYKNMFRNLGRYSLIASLFVITVLVLASSTSQATQKKKEAASQAGKPILWSDPG